MKVVKKGTGQKGWAKEFDCTGAGNGSDGCGATLLIEEGDVYETFSSHYDGSNYTYNTFQCPECAAETDIKGYPRSSIERRRKRRQQLEVGG